MFRTLFRPVALAAFSLVLLSCGGSTSGDCGVEAQKQFVLDVVYDWYLFQEDLPARSSVNPDNFATADDLLDFLTANARAQGKDRFFSFLTTQQEEDAFFGEGQTIAFGFVTQLRPDPDGQHWHLFVAKVEPASPAHDAGFHRGDEILAIGPDEGHMTSISSLSGSKENVQQDIAFLFGPFQIDPPVTRVFRVRPVSGGSPVTRTATKEVITLDPVPRTVEFTRSGTTPIGYVAFDTFIEPAEQQLRDAFAAFKADNVQDVVVDLRYNGGGLISIAKLLADLLADDLAGDLMFRFVFNADHSNENESVFFEHQPEGVRALRIAFITSGGTASASELAINSLEPYAQVAIVGSQTFGKPVGQAGFDMPDCDTVLRLIAFKTVNSDNEGDYFNGLPDAQFSGDFCPADDDLTAERGDQGEDSTATALSWIDQGACPAAGKASKAPALMPRLQKPTMAQDAQPGLF